MASTQQVQLYNGVIATDTTTLGEAQSLNIYAKEFILSCEVSSRSDGTYTLTVEHSPDGINWFTFDAVAAISSDIMSIKVNTSHAFQFVRASILSASTTSGANVEAKLWYSNSK